MGQSPCYDQVLTGILPYDHHNGPTIITHIRSGARPSRPTDPSQNRWLHDLVWDEITTGWSHKKDQRSQLSVMYNAFSTSASQQGVRNVKLGNVYAQNSGNHQN